MVAPSVEGLTADQSAALLYALEAERARRHFKHYANLVSGDEYEQPEHVELLIDALEAVFRGEIRRLMVNMPPRGSKSMHCSRLFPSFWMGKRPKDGVILSSYGDLLATDNGRSVRDLMQHDDYPFETKLRPDAKAAGRWETVQGGGLVAVGRGAGITGWKHSGNLVVPDDLIKDREEADSIIIRDKAWSYWQDTLQTRLARDGVVVFPCTRWHEDDPAGRLLNSKGASDWDVITLPYYAEDDDILGREPGVALTTYGYIPSVEKGEISSYSFSAEYQQRPTPIEGGLFKRAWMQRWASLPPDRIDEQSKPFAGRWHVVMTVDSAWDEGVGHDYSVIATWATDGVDYFVLDCWRGRVEYPDLKAELNRRYTGQRWRPRAIYVEDAANGRPLIQELRRSGLPIVGRKPVGSKESRADAATPWFESKHVYLPPDAEWVDDWITEHLLFPNVTHDDQVDTTSSALKELAGGNAFKQQSYPIQIVSAARKRPTKADAIVAKFRTARGRSA